MSAPQACTQTRRLRGSIGPGWRLRSTIALFETFAEVLRKESPTGHCTFTCMYTGWAKKRGHRLMTIILSNLNRFAQFFSLEDSLVNWKVNGY